MSLKVIDLTWQQECWTCKRLFIYWPFSLVGATKPGKAVQLLRTIVINITASNGTHCVTSCRAVCCVALISDQWDTWFAAAAWPALWWKKRWAGLDLRRRTRQAKVVAECIGNPHSWTTRGVSLKLNEKHCFRRSIGSDHIRQSNEKAGLSKAEGLSHELPQGLQRKEKKRKLVVVKVKSFQLLADHTSCCDSQLHQGTSYSSQTESTNQITLLPVTLKG